MKFSLYIHIPFCEKKCYYCDFVSFPDNEANIKYYIDNLIKELNLYKDHLSKYKLDTIFIGGGTPSSIDSKYIIKILELVYTIFDSKEIREITIEANPGTINMKKARDYKSVGINRISLGLQSLNDKLLKSIGRIHSSKDFIDTINILRNEGFDNINADLIFGLPSQTMKDLGDTLAGVIDLNLEHISLYGLIIEENTLINKWYKKGLLALPSEDAEREMYHRSIESLNNNEYYQYEISNFSKQGKECLHNLAYWQLKPYLGVGLSSHSNLFKKRFWNYSNINKYNQLLFQDILPIEGNETISYEMEMAEYCILGLRLTKGLIKESFKDRFGIDINSIYGDIIRKHKHNGLLKEDYKSICLTNKGKDLSNLVEVDFMP